MIAPAIGFDLGRSTGVVILDQFGMVDWCRIIDCGPNTPGWRTPAGPDRLRRFVGELPWLPGGRTPVGFEQVVHAKGKGAMLIHHLAGAVMREYYKQPAFYGPIVSELKKYATGNGAAKKPEMAEAVPANEWPALVRAAHDVSTAYGREEPLTERMAAARLEDLVDAYWVARWTQEQHSGREG